jgi:hypothetical protein
MSGTGADACETRLMLLILARLQQLPGAMFWRVNVGAAIDRTGRRIRFGEPGHSDLLGCARGRLVAIEVKSASGRLRDEQRVWGDRIAAAGGIYIIARCLEDALEPVQRVLGGAP